VFACSFDVEAVEQVCTGGPLDREDILATLIGLVDTTARRTRPRARAAGREA